MLLSVVLRLQPDRPLTNVVSLGRAAHAGFLKLINQVNPGLAWDLHRSTVNPFTIAISTAGNTSDVTATGKAALIDLRIASIESKVSSLLRNLQSSWIAQLTLMNVKCKVVRIFTETGAHPWVQESTFLEILNNGLARARRGELEVEFRFLSPTSFSLAESRLSMPLPWPRLVFQSLAQRWNAFSPVPLWINWLEFDRCVSISDCRVRTYRVDFGRFGEIGFVGTCRFVLAKGTELELRRSLHALAEFAFFSGVGKKTSMGMGFVVPTLTKCGRRKRVKVEGSSTGRSAYDLHTF